MKFTRSSLRISALSLALAGCSDIKTRTETSDILHEDAAVLSRIYTPSRHDSGLDMTAVNLSDNIGVGFGGGVGIRIGGGLQISSTIIPERYGAVFQCQHGTFTSEGSDNRHRDLYNKLHEGQKVDVTYKEIYTATYKDVNGDGKEDLVSRVLVNLDFLDANPK